MQVYLSDLDDSPKRPQGAPQTAHNSHKTQHGPRRPQDGAKTCQDGPRRRQDDPTTPPNHSKTALQALPIIGGRSKIERKSNRYRTFAGQGAPGRGGRGKEEPGKQRKQPDDGKSALRSASVVEIELHVAKKGGSKGVPIRRGRGGPDPTRQCSSYYSLNRVKRNRFTSFYNLKVDWEAQGEHRRTLRHALFPFPVQAQV